MGLFGPILGLIWLSVGSDLGPICVQFGSNLALIWLSFGVTLAAATGNQAQERGTERGEKANQALGHLREGAISQRIFDGFSLDFRWFFIGFCWTFGDLLDFVEFSRVFVGLRWVFCWIFVCLKTEGVGWWMA